MHRMKRSWTDADFPNLSWHDNSVHAFRVIEGKDGAGELVLDIDHIVEWIESQAGYEFRVAPAELRFRDVTDLRMTLDYSAATAALTPFTLDRIQVDQMRNGQSNRWTLKVNWPVGEISFSSTGFTLRLTGESVVSSAQSLEPAQRIKYIATRELAAFQPERGDFAVTVCIGQPYCVGEDEWECPVALPGLHCNLHGPHGADAFQALMLAQNLAHTLLVYFVQDGGRLLDAPGGRPVDVAALFQKGILS
jgi:hypothetical protein